MGCATRRSFARYIPLGIDDFIFRHALHTAATQFKRQPIFAAADGIVVAARSDRADSESLLRRPGESMEVYEARTREAVQFALQRGSRSGRVAWQFARSYAGAAGLRRRPGA